MDKEKENKEFKLKIEKIIKIIGAKIIKFKKEHPYLYGTIILMVIVCIISAFIFAFRAYKKEEKKVKEEKESSFYEYGYKEGEKEKHVSNQGSIIIDSIKEAANLEVLEVRDVEFVFQGPDKNITVWLEVPGTGTFIVDLQISEFIIDNDRNYILIRVPEPELTACKIDYAGVKQLKFENDVFNDSIAIGEDMAREMLQDGYLLIQKEFASNQRYYNSAKAAAESLIIGMVKEANLNRDNLQVEVEFMK